MPAVTVAGHTYHPGQVNNVYIFPAMSFAAIHCHAKEITDRLFSWQPKPSPIHLTKTILQKIVLSLTLTAFEMLPQCCDGGGSCLPRGWTMLLKNMSANFITVSLGYEVIIEN